jgi:hypothetical protein
MKNPVMADLQRRFDALPVPLPCPHCLPSLIVRHPQPSGWYVTPAWPCSNHIDPSTGRFSTYR